MATDKQNRWQQAVNHYITEVLTFDWILEQLQEDLNKYMKLEKANVQKIQERQQYIFQLQRFQSYSLQALNAGHDVIAELLITNQDLQARVKELQALNELIKTDIK